MGVAEAGRSARLVHESRTVREAWGDKRTRLTSSGLAPMQLVFGDVHHCHVYIARTRRRPPLGHAGDARPRPEYRFAEVLPDALELAGLDCDRFTGASR